MKKLIILKETYLKFLLGFSFILINNISYLNAEILTRSRPDPEIRQKIHKILQKALREEYIVGRIDLQKIEYEENLESKFYLTLQDMLSNNLNCFYSNMSRWMVKNDENMLFALNNC